MTVPESVENLIPELLDGAILSEDFNLLEQWLRKDPANPRLLAEYALLDRMLFCEQLNLDTTAILAMLLEMEQAAEPIELYHVPMPTLCERLFEALHAKELKWFGVTAAVVMACSLSIWLILSVLTSQDGASDTITQATQPPAQQTTNAAFAVITAQHDARWVVSTRGVGDALYTKQRLVLIDGAAEITTRHGARAVLHAPCEITIIGENEVRLTRGKLVGSCPTQRSKGFVVETPDARIVDVGTEFGVSVNAEGVVDVRVFTGFVDVATGIDRDQKQFLATGDLARVASGRLERVAYDVAFDFQRDLRVRATAPQLTGQVRWLLSPPPSIFEHELVDANSAYLFLEKENAVVPSGTVMTASGPSPPIQQLIDRAVVESEMKADVYILHFDPVKLHHVGNTLSGEGRVQGRIVFDRPIVGLITQYLRLRRTQPLFANPDVKYGYKTSRGLEDGEAQIGSDGRTLIFDLSAKPNDLDQMRILVAPQDDGT